MRRWITQRCNLKAISSIGWSTCWWENSGAEYRLCGTSSSSLKARSSPNKRIHPRFRPSSRAKLPYDDSQHCKFISTALSVLSTRSFQEISPSEHAWNQWLVTTTVGTFFSLLPMKSGSSSRKHYTILSIHMKFRLDCKEVTTVVNICANSCL